MTRNRREIRRAIEELADADETPTPCPDCGGMPPGYDDAEGVTAEFVTHECTCDRDDGATVVCSWEEGDDADPDDAALVIDFTEVDT